MNHHLPISPILPSDTAVESGHVVSGLAGGDAEADLGDAGASSGATGPAEQEGGEGEVLPQTARASPEQPTASQFADHDLTHLHYRAWCPDCCEIFGLQCGLFRRFEYRDPRDQLETEGNFVSSGCDLT